MSNKRLLVGLLLASVGGLFLTISLTGAVPLPWRSDGPTAEARTAVLSGGFFSHVGEPPADPALASAPGLVSFQGLLTDPGTGAPVADAAYSIRFSVWDTTSGPTEVWNETQNVTTEGGLFNVLLGSVTPLTRTVFDGDPRYLEVKVGSDPAMTPRQRFATVPYAFFAEEAHELGSLRVELNGTSPNLIGGYSGNSVTSGAVAATIGGGGVSASTNRVTDDYGTVGGGRNNQAGDNAGTTSDRPYATVGGGRGNTASGAYATVAGGVYNTASELTATVGGGYGNTASGYEATVGGGDQNTASEDWATVGGGRGNTADYQATVPGGYYNTAAGDYATVGGGNSNAASFAEATVGGGYSNAASGTRATVGGGYLNTASGSYATVSGGSDNDAGQWATVSGGDGNNASGPYATVGGGWINTAGGDRATVGGGYSNDASGGAATVPGGYNNTAAGMYSFAAGHLANANNQGCFVWGDSTNANVTCNNNDRWVVQAGGGVYFYSNSSLTSGSYLAAGSGSWSSVSDRDLKENLTPVDGREVLARVADIPITTWNYESQDSEIRHMGPAAQDLYAAFGLGEDERYISTVDADGVTLAAIQGLYELVQEQDSQIAALEQRLTELEQGGGSAAAAASPSSLGRPATWLVVGGLLLAGLVLGGLATKALRSRRS